MPFSKRRAPEFSCDPHVVATVSDCKKTAPNRPHSRPHFHPCPQARPHHHHHLHLQSLFITAFAVLTLGTTVVGTAACNEKTEKAAEEVKEGAKLAAKDSLKGSKKVAKRVGDNVGKGAKKLGRKTREWSKKGKEAASDAVDKVKEKAQDVKDTGLCKVAYAHLKKCYGDELKGDSKTKVLTKCSAAVAGGHEEVKKVLYCLRDSEGDCPKVKKCVPLSVLKMLASQ